MSLTSRVSLGSLLPSEGEDVLLSYTSPRLPRPLSLSIINEPTCAAEEKHHLQPGGYVSHTSLLLADLIEAGSLGGGDAASFQTAGGSEENKKGPGNMVRAPRLAASAFDVTGLSTLELGASTALPSLVAVLAGARRVAVTACPSRSSSSSSRCSSHGRRLAALHANVARNAGAAATLPPDGVMVETHAFGDTSTPLAVGNEGVFDRVFVVDGLGFAGAGGGGGDGGGGDDEDDEEERNDALRRSIDWFLRRDEGSRCWVVVGAAATAAAFFEAEKLAAVRLVVEMIVERDEEGREREWLADRSRDDIGEPEGWMVVAVLKRLRI